MTEIWKPIPGHEKYYEASSLGKIRSRERTGYHPKNKHGRPHTFNIKQKTRKTCLDRYGYEQICLKAGGTKRTVTVHRLIAITFLGEKYFPGAQINHKNSIRTDNRVENLEWCTCQENIIHAQVFGKRKSKVTKGYGWEIGF